MLKVALSPQKRKHIRYMEIVVASTKKEKFCIKSRYELVKVIKNLQIATPQIHSLNVVPKNSNSLLQATNVPNHW